MQRDTLVTLTGDAVAGAAIAGGAVAVAGVAGGAGGSDDDKLIIIVEKMRSYSHTDSIMRLFAVS